MNKISFDNKRNISKNGHGPLTSARNAKSAREVTVCSSPDKIGMLVAKSLAEDVKRQLVK